MNNIFHYQTSLGKITIADNGNAITGLYFNEDLLQENAAVKESPLIREAYSQVLSYFEGNRKDFSLPLYTKGTFFQQTVWEALKTIPYGETKSYKEIALMIGNPKAYRAVGMTNNKNPISIIIPCHRVIGADGSLIGYGSGLEIKAALLELERKHVCL